jgi:hypothetical protein
MGLRLFTEHHPNTGPRDRLLDRDLTAICGILVDVGVGAGGEARIGMPEVAGHLVERATFGGCPSCGAPPARKSAATAHLTFTGYCIGTARRVLSEHCTRTSEGGRR